MTNTVKLCFRSCTVILSLSAGIAAAQVPERSTHEQAARGLLRVMGVVRTAEAGAEAMMGTIRGNPELAPFEDVFRAWYKKVIATGDFEGEMAEVYMRHFTEQELREIATFYETPLGHKMLETMQEVMKEGAEVGMKRAKEHAPELEQMLKKAREEGVAKGGDQ
jgi:hypothetical protein